jgi:hypothetical protein
LILRSQPAIQYKEAFLLRDASLDGLAKSQEMRFYVIPAKANQRRSLANQRRSLAGIQEKQVLLDPGLCRGDGLADFLRTHQALLKEFFFLLLILPIVKAN